METNDIATKNFRNHTESVASKNRKYSNSSFMNVRLKETAMKRKNESNNIQNVNKKQRISNNLPNGRMADDSDDDASLTIDEGAVKMEISHEANGGGGTFSALEMECWFEKTSTAQIKQFSEKRDTFSMLENLLNNLISKEKTTINGDSTDGKDDSKNNPSKRKTKIVNRSDLHEPNSNAKSKTSFGTVEDSSSPSEAVSNQTTTNARKKSNLFPSRSISTKRTNAQLSYPQTNSLNKVPRTSYQDSKKPKLSANFRQFTPSTPPISATKLPIAPFTPISAKSAINSTINTILNTSVSKSPAVQSNVSEPIKTTPRKEASPDIEVVSEKKTSTVAKPNKEITAKSPYLSVISYTPLLNILARPFNMHPVAIAVRDRKDLDLMVKNILMRNQKEFVEWLFKMRLLKDRMSCYKHRTGNEIKLVLSHSSSPLPPSGGYAWMMECCQGGRKYISVFSGSIFAIGLKEKMSSTSVLKLIYHWSCQTTIKNVENWVKVSCEIISRAFNYFRCICTVILNDKLYDLGAGGSSVELGIVSLGTTTSSGNKKAVKVEIMGLYDRKTNSYRLFASSPQNTTNSTQRFMKILKPVLSVVHHSAEIVCDYSVDRTCLPMMNYRNVVFCNQNCENSSQNSNSKIMAYLRKHIPKMFQNTLSTLNLEQVQLILDELCWRETYGKSPSHSYINMTNHIAYLTVRETNYYGLLSFLDYVSVNPHRLWRYVSEPNVPQVNFPADEIPTLQADTHPMPESTTVVFTTTPIIHPSVDVDAAVRARQASVNMPIDVDLSNLVVPYLHANKMARGPQTSPSTLEMAVTLPEMISMKNSMPKPTQKVDTPITQQSPKVTTDAVVNSVEKAVGRDSPDESPSVVQNVIATSKDGEKKENPSVNSSDTLLPLKLANTKSFELTTSKSFDLDTKSIELATPKSVASPISGGRLTTSDQVVELTSYFYGEIPGDEKLGKEVNFCELKCHKCSFKTNDNIDFYEHMKSHLLEHKIPDMVNCKYCVLQFPDEETCSDHVKNVHDPENDSLICRICMITFHGEEFLISHMVKNHSEADLPYKCEVCKYSTSYYMKLADHFREAHKGSPYVMCHFCLSVKIISPGHHWNIGQWILNHLTDHSKGYRCSHCQLTLKKKSKANNLAHMVQHNSHKDSKDLVRYTSSKPIYIQKKSLVSGKSNYEMKYPVKPLVAMSSEVEACDALVVKSKELCKECEEPMDKAGHYRSYQKCVSCPYATSCAVMMPHHNYVFHNHNKTKKVYEIGPPILLKEPLVCNCGFASKSGNHIARHMMRCRGANKTAYAEEPSTFSLNIEDNKTPSPTKTPKTLDVKKPLDVLKKKSRFLAKEDEDNNSTDNDVDDPDDPDVMMQELSDED